MTAKEKDPVVALETLPGGIPDLSKPATAARFAEIISAGSLDKLTPQQQSVFLAGLGAYIGIKPELGDLMIYEGRPYITISGYRRIAHNTGLLDGLSPMPASDRDRARYSVKDGEHLWVCHVHKKGSVRAFIGWGYVRSHELKARQGRNGSFEPVTMKFPQEMARKRAVYDGLRLAFPPNEAIGAIHLHYIDEAERAAAGNNAVSRLADGDYTEAAVADEIAGEAITADSSVEFQDDRNLVDQ